MVKTATAAIIDAETEASARPKPKAVAKVKTPASEVASSWLATIERLAPHVGIEGVRELMAMRRQEQDRQAEQEFNAAMSTAQAALIPVTRNQKNKQTGSSYADLAAIAEMAMPIIHKHGFGTSASEFRSDKPDHVGVALEVMHRSGHSKRYEFHVPSDGTGLKGNPNKTATHAYASTLNYGERYAKCRVFGIATKDDDGNAASATNEVVTDVQVGQIKSLIVETNSDIAKFCAYFKIEAIVDLPAKRFDEAVGLLDGKRRAQI